MRPKKFEIGDRVSFWRPLENKKLKGHVIKLVKDCAYVQISTGFKYAIHPKSLTKLKKLEPGVIPNQ